MKSFHCAPWVALLCLSLFAGAGHSQCLYKDAVSGEPTMAIGGRAMADAIRAVDARGDYARFHDYEVWDTNNDGIPDRLQMALLTEILCLPPSVPHPTIDVAAVQNTFIQNLVAYEEFLEKARQDEADILAIAPLMRDVGIELKTAATAVGRDQEILAVSVFLAGEIPDEWVGKTYFDLARLMRRMGMRIVNAENNGHIGDQLAGTVWVALDTTGTAHLAAGLMGLGVDLVHTVLGRDEYLESKQFLLLRDLDLDFLRTEFGLDPAGVSALQTALNEMDLSAEDIPVLDVDFAVYLTADPDVELLSPDAQWGADPTDTLANLAGALGDDPDVIWQTVKDSFAFPMPDVVGTTLEDALIVFSAWGLVLGELSYQFDDSMPEGHILVSAPEAGAEVEAGMPVDLVLSLGVNPCPMFYNLYGVPTMEIGGLAVANAVRFIDVHNEYPHYHDYYAWDADLNGIPDHIQFALLTKVLCLPHGAAHPTIDVAEVQDIFWQNYTLYWDRVDTLRAEIDTALAVAPNLINLSNQMRTSGAPELNQWIEAEAFLDGVLPEPWEGKTYRALADFMKAVGDGAIWHDEQGNIDTVATALDSEPAAHLIAAVMGMSQGLIDRVLNHTAYLQVVEGLVLTGLDWQYLATLFSLTPDDVSAMETAIDAIGVDVDFIPAPGEDFFVLESDGVEIFSPDAPWGGEGQTLQELFDEFGDDVEALWAAIESAFTSTVRVTFNAWGGTTPDPLFIDAALSAPYGPLAETSRNGYSFGGWFTAPIGGMQVTADTLVTTATDHTFYAQWMPNTYTVTFDAHGGAPAEPPEKEVFYGWNYGTLAATARTGWVFNGWFTAPVGGTQITATTLMLTTEDHTLYAQWTPISFAVTYIADPAPGGMLSGPATINHEGTPGDEITISAVPYEGWSLAEVTATVGTLEPVGNQYRLSGVTADTTIIAVFSELPLPFAVRAASPTSVTVPLGTDEVTFRVAVQGARGNLSFQWYHLLEDQERRVIHGADRASFTIYNVKEEDMGRYLCEVYDDVLDQTESSPVFTLRPAPEVPAAGFIGLALIAVAAAWAGAATLRKKR